MLSFEFPEQLLRLHAVMRAQEDTLRRVANLYADAIGAGGVVHVYANGHSRLAVEEMCIRMGALTGFHPMLQAGLATFTDVVGANGIRVNQAIEKVEGLGAKLLEEVDVAPGEPLVAISATGQTPAAVDIAVEWLRRYPDNPLICLCSIAQSEAGQPKHSSGLNLTHVAHRAKVGIVIDNGMPIGDTAVKVAGQTDIYPVCPVSSIGAITVVQCLNELTIRELDRRHRAHPVLRNMHLNDTHDSYNAWLRDQRERYARVLNNPNRIPPR
jgi:uncharacterized phosphosugar-binding protein